MRGCRPPSTGARERRTTVAPLTTTTTTFTADDDLLAGLRRPREDVLLEVVDGPDRFRLGDGPFERYERELVAEPAGDGLHRVTQTVRWQLAIPLWWPLFRPLVRRLIRSYRPAPAVDPDARSPWWSPPTRFDARSTSILSWLCGLCLLTGYLGTLITQTITFSAEEFGVGSAAQGNTLAAVRLGVLISAALMVVADRRGRRHLLVLTMFVGTVTAALGALSPNLAFLGSTQLVSRACSTALALIITVIAAEEMPAGGRAYAASVLAMTSALGAGSAVFLVPIAGISSWSWRILYVLPLLVLPVFVRISRHLPESRRFRRRRGPASLVGHRAKLALLCAVGFLGLLFYAPNTQFMNDFLRTEHGFRPYQLTLFTILTTTPGGIGVIVGGRLADVRGRRVVGAISGIVGASLLALSYSIGLPWLWVTSMLGSIVGGATVPALAVYGPELFPTSMRGKANGIISVAGVSGSAVGLLIAGRLQEHFGRYGPGLALLALGPWLVGLLVFTLYPETANRELEELNPQDAITPVTPGAML